MTKERLRLFSFEDLCRIAEKGNIPYFDIAEKDKLIESIIENCREDQEERNTLLNYALRIEAMKYSVSLDEEIDIYFDEYHEFPERYNETKIVFLLRDPTWGFVFWDVDNAKLDEIKDTGEFTGFFLKVIELSCSTYDSDNIVDSFDVPVNFDDLDQYVNLPERNASYCVELHARLQDGEQFICRSNILTTNANTVAPGGDYEFSDLLIKLSGFSSGLEEFPGNLDLEGIPQRIIPIDNREDEDVEYE
jgi:hypothetical protein